MRIQWELFTTSDIISSICLNTFAEIKCFIYKRISFQIIPWILQLNCLKWNNRKWTSSYCIVFFYNEWVIERASEQAGGRASERASEWVSEWMGGSVSQSVSQPLFLHISQISNEFAALHLGFYLPWSHISTRFTWRRCHSWNWDPYFQICDFTISASFA